MKGNQAKRPGVCLYSGGGFVCIREKGKKEGRKKERKERRKSMEQMSGCPVVMALLCSAGHVHYSFLIGHIFLLPYQPSKVVGVIESI